MHDATQGNIFPRMQQNHGNIPTILPVVVVVLCKHTTRLAETFPQLQRNRGNIPTILPGCGGWWFVSMM